MGHRRWQRTNSVVVKSLVLRSSLIQGRINRYTKDILSERPSGSSLFLGAVRYL